MGVDPAEPSTPESFQRFIHAEIDRMAAFIKTAGIKVD